MKLSESTIASLKNFGVINDFIILRNGNVQRTGSTERDMTARVELDQPLEIEGIFPIYDLNTFLSAISSMNDPDLTFHNNMVRVVDADGVSLTYRAADKRAGFAPPDVDFDLSNYVVKFHLPVDIYKRLVRLANGLGLEDMQVETREDGVYIVVKTATNELTNLLELKVGELEDDTPVGETYIVKLYNFKFVPDDYDVTVVYDETALIAFESEARKYYVALELE